jgi:hypothetical protein
MMNSQYRSWAVQAVKNSPALHAKQSQVIDTVAQGIALFKEHESSSYYSSSGRKIKRPKQYHNPITGRYNQRDARTVLISALARAWLIGTGKKARINNKNHRDSPFVMFATEVFRLLGIGNMHKHLEEYTSVRKTTWNENELMNASESSANPSQQV